MSQKRYEQVAELINNHLTPSDICRKLGISRPIFRDARKRAAEKGLIDYRLQSIGRPPQHEPSPKLVETDEAAAAWIGAQFTDSAIAAKPAPLKTYRSEYHGSWSSLGERR